jgi:hypothetical protein
MTGVAPLPCMPKRNSKIRPKDKNSEPQRAQKAKAQLASRYGEADWCRGIGIAPGEEGGLALRINVAPGALAAGLSLPSEVDGFPLQVVTLKGYDKRPTKAVGTPSKAPAGSRSGRSRSSEGTGAAPGKSGGPAKAAAAPGAPRHSPVRGAAKATKAAGAGGAAGVGTGPSGRKSGPAVSQTVRPPTAAKAGAGLDQERAARPARKRRPSPKTR